MGLFGKKQKEDVKSFSSLSELPKLPTLPKISNEFSLDEDQPHQLPSLPSSSFGEKFSQNAIKDAVSGFPGKEEDDEEEEDADESELETRMMQRPPIETKVQEEGRENLIKSSRKHEPIFIRIDKFEESLQLLEQSEKKIVEMENLFKDIRRIKEEEEIELNNWESNIQSIKKQIEKIDEDIFSKVE